jgi:hypothetical protein
VPEIAVDVDDGRTQVEVATAVVAALRGVGIPAAVKPHPLPEFSDFASAGSGQEMLRLGWTGASDSPESFLRPLFLTGSLDNVFGYTMSARSGETVVKLIGYADIAVAVALAAFVVGALLERGALYRLAYSKAAMGVFAWAAVWGFATAFSRITSADTWYPEVWDWVERAPNFVLPAAMIYVIARHRTLVVPTHLPTTKELTAA